MIQSVLTPRQWTHLQAVRARNYQQRWLREQGLLHLGEVFSKANGTKVLHGPFAGMQYPAESLQSHHCVPALLGNYESELHLILDSILEDSYDLVVDVGCAEGYYAVGFALKNRFPVAAFDADPRELKLCRAMARMNEVEDRISFGSWCSAELLGNLTAGKRTFVLSDCEGFETELFDEPAIAALKQSDALVEIHGEAYEPLLQRFSKTHVVQTLIASPRSTENYPELACLGSEAIRAVAEYRLPGQRWLYARARQVSQI